MKENYSSVSNEEMIGVSLDLREEVSVRPGKVRIECFIKNGDSRKESAEATRKESIRLLKLALEHLEANE